MATPKPAVFDKYLTAVRTSRPIVQMGRVVRISGMVAEADGPGLGIGSLCRIRNVDSQDVQAEVVGFRDNRVIVMPLGELRGVKPGSKVVALTHRATVSVGPGYLGRVVDGLGRPLDGKGPIETAAEYPVYGSELNPLSRRIIREPLDVGVCSINALTTVGRGQRIAIMAGSGVGKSVLMGMIARHTTADVNVIALIGERGREVKEFVEQNLGAKGLEKSIVVAATSDAPALVRIRGAHIANSLAEYFRDRGRDVLLIMDSVTRFAMSLREVGLAAGEPPAAKGYTPSVFNQLPKFLERAGTAGRKGSITGIYTVLVEGDDMNEPIADAVRSIVDGHIVLSRDLARKGHYPAVDILSSISRVMPNIVAPEHRAAARELLKVVSVYREAEDLINIGAYIKGSDARIDRARQMIRGIEAFLQQDMSQSVSLTESIARLKRLMAEG